jgi:hypothetical protein
MNGVVADKKPERRYVGRLPTRVAPENKTAGNPSETIAILIGMLSVFGVLFCLLLEVIDVSADVDLMSLKISANFGLLGLFAVVFLNVVYGAVVYGRALLKRTPRRHRLPQQSATLTPSAWPGAETSVHEPH